VQIPDPIRHAVVVLAAGVVAAALVAGAAVLVSGAPAGAGSFEKINAYDTTITIEESGDLLIRETIVYDFGVLSRHGIFRDIPVRFDYPKKEDTDRVYEIDVQSVTGSPGTPTQYELEEFTQNGIGYDRIRIGDPDRTITGEHTYDITYRVRGALNGFEDHDELYWNAIGDQWSVTIQEPTATVEAPAEITRATCFQGPFGSSLPCDSQRVDGSSALFTQAQLFPFSGLTVVVAIPKGIVPEPKPILEERLTFGRAFEVTPVTGGIAGGLLLLLLGGFGLLFWRTARDRRAVGSSTDQAFAAAGAPEERVPLFDKTETPVEFVPPDDLRPGQVGTLVDFKANPLDVTATIIDLAVRKYLIIDEVDTESRWMSNDWKLTKLKDADGKLLKYEQELLDGLFRDDDEVVLSELKYKFAERMGTVRTSLMDDAMERKWFTKRPGGAALGVGCLGLLVLLAGVALTVLLGVFANAGLVGIPVIILGIVMLFTARLAPARTAQGTAALRRVNGFRRFIDESEKERARFAEKKHLFSEYLPYAVVFGATEKWARAFSGLDGEPPDTSGWYRSTTPFEYVAFSSAMHGFTTTTAGTLTSSPPSTSGSSGFSGGGGGGFSGGGGGGGGGGSW
jgi:uncharacterized membrane protein YgcG